MGLIPDTTRVIFNEASKIERQVDFTNVVDIYRNINYNQLSKIQDYKLIHLRFILIFK